MKNNHKQTEDQASSSWGWEQFAKYLPIGRFWERSIGRNRIGFPHINICQVFLRDLEHTHTQTHKVGGPDLLFLGLGAICGARRGRIQWPEWLLPAIVFVLCCILPVECNRIYIALYCIVAPGRNRPICQKWNQCRAPTAVVLYHPWEHSRL